ncbi:M28 family peptidase [Sphingomonas japonica]|uniref:Peptidase M28 domain-containing protein n=1 Tax=Sphingomonas japonica TaxID=511662 RepID=A0ABX0U377_9SPHN|nr:M28 family peptidase [Sphingomonas japonica]NIJ24141.1 hypothetical protein [Sphingomonas japonica]
MRLLVPLALFATPAAAQDAPDSARLRADVETLVDFGTRHTASSTTDPNRGIGAARRWAAERLGQIGEACGECITVANVARTFTGPRAPGGVEVVDVLGFQGGTDPGRVVIVAAHIDSINGDVMDAAGDAPGANDNGSGTALVLEAARILSRERFDATIVYALLSGEEQGLWGGTLLADIAAERGWTVSAVLNNDIVGNSIGGNGAVRADTVRIFSEGIRSAEDSDAARARRAIGGEDDGPSRALAKAIDGLADETGGLDAFLVRRPDRFGRGGDHEPFLARGYPAVRFSVAAENYRGQHQNVRSEDGTAYGDTSEKMDFAYLAKITALNVAAIRRFASAPAAPRTVTLEGALAYDTRVAWTEVPGAARYRVRWRRADTQDWTDQRDVTGTQLTLPIVVDDHFIGVSALSASGAESIVTFGERAPRR